MTPTADRQYLDLLRQVRTQGSFRQDRTGTGTYSIFGAQLRVDLSREFPLLTTKRIPFKSVAAELLWMLKGHTNVRWLQARGVTIWDEWADETGELGPVYGAQWRSWPSPDGSTIDQIARVCDEIRRNPDSRRLVVSAWNPADVPRMALPPCHCLFQFYVDKGSLSCHLYQRSADIFLGVPFNIASYALLTRLLCASLQLRPGDFIHSFGDLHLYANHLEQADRQLGREPRTAPGLVVTRRCFNVWDYDLGDFDLLGYDPHPTITALVAV